jgi:hypothetical protein
VSSRRHRSSPSTPPDRRILITPNCIVVSSLPLVARSAGRSGQDRDHGPIRSWIY